MSYSWDYGAASTSASVPGYELYQVIDRSEPPSHRLWVGQYQEQGSLFYMSVFSNSRGVIEPDQVTLGPQEKIPLPAEVVTASSDIEPWLLIGGDELVYPGGERITTTEQASTYGMYQGYTQIYAAAPSTQTNADEGEGRKQKRRGGKKRQASPSSQGGPSDLTEASF